MAVPLADAADIFEVQRDSKWQMTGWHVDNAGGVAIYHHRGCTMCSTYAAHLMAAYGEGTVWLPNRLVGEVIETAFPSIICDVDDAAEDQWKKHVQSCNREIKDLKDVLNEEHDMTDDFKNNLKRECDVTKSLEQELKTLRERRTCHTRWRRRPNLLLKSARGLPVPPRPRA